MYIQAVVLYLKIFLPDIAEEQEQKAKAQEARAKVILAEAEIPLAIAEAFRECNLGIMDYYKLQNIQAEPDNSMW